MEFPGRLTTVLQEQTWDLEMGPVAGAETVTTDPEKPPYVGCMLFLSVLAIVSLGVCFVLGTPVAKKVLLPIFFSSLVLVVAIFGCATMELSQEDQTEEGTDETSERRREQTEHGHGGVEPHDQSHVEIAVALSFLPSMTVASF